MSQTGGATPASQIRAAPLGQRPAVNEEGSGARAGKAPGEFAPQVMQKPYAMEKPIAVDKLQGKPAEGNAKLKEGKATIAAGG